MTSPAWEPTVFPLDVQQQPVTAAGEAIVCDGCGTRLPTQPPDTQQRPVPADIARINYGLPYGVLTFVVCERGEPCFDLAVLTEELYRTIRCTVPGCRGDRCSP